MTLQEIIQQLEIFWSKEGCNIVQPYDIEIGAGTFHPATALKVIGDKPWRVAYPQPCRRPADGRYGENPGRLQKYIQFQVLIKPACDNPQKLYLESLRKIGIKQQINDIRYVKDDWKSPTLGASGMGWEVWCNGMEISQFTYFQQFAGMECKSIPLEITYGLERIAMHVQNVDEFRKIRLNHHTLYQEMIDDDEKQFSTYYFEVADVDMIIRHFQDYQKEAKILIDKKLAKPAYDYCLKASHAFNILDARGALSTFERTNYINKVRNITNNIAKIIIQDEANHN